jgi:hypothetical protein
MHHSANELQVLDVLEETSLILTQEIEAFMLNELTSNFKCDLITPCVNERHRDVINKDSHLLATWWRVSFNLLLLYFCLN